MASSKFLDKARLSYLWNRFLQELHGYHDITKADVDDIPTKTSDLINDSDFVSSSTLSIYNGAVADGFGLDGISLNNFEEEDISNG